MIKKTIQISHPNFFIDKKKRTGPHEMASFHLHQDYEIFYISQGERKFFISDTIYKASAGNLVLVDVNEIHKTGDFAPNGHERIVLNFTAALLSDFSPAMESLNLFSCFKSKHKVLPLSFKYKNLIENNLNRLLEISNNDSYPDNDFKNFHIKTLICDLMILINNFIHDFKLKDYNSIHTIDAKVTKVIRYINENYNQDITLSSVAKEFYTSASYLSKLFKKTTNFTFVEYLNSIRIKKSKDLLQNSDFKIIDIAEKVGFNNNTHFTRVFKEIIGMSPMQFRQLVHKNI